ncbi:thioredoxin family protein [SAR202 cluster bacterium AD-804-J14_MRT_500m]|nr:thioredoxin family protein [SAR202 cluster bacterium AD-804-J14_MRT_500m]
MIEQISVVTHERFAQGMAYAEYIDQIKVNKKLFQKYYDEFTLSDEESDFFRQCAGKPNGLTKLLVLGEDWCPDVYRGIPTIARVAEAAELELRIFPRDDNLDIMNEFLKEGKYQSIPAFVFYTDNLDYICHWIERPEIGNQESAAIEEAIRGENPDITDREFGIERRNRTAARFPMWQGATVRELQDMLATHFN